MAVLESFDIYGRDELLLMRGDRPNYC